MAKLLVNHVDGTQRIFEVGEGGRYIDESAVLWDERIHGIMPDDIELGAMTYEDSVDDLDRPIRTLLVDADLLAAHEQEQAALADAQAQKAREDAAIAAAKEAIADQTWNQLIKAERLLVLGQPLDETQMTALLAKYPQE